MQHKLTVHRKTDAMVDVYVDDVLITTQNALRVGFPSRINMGQGGSLEGGVIDVDSYKVGVPRKPSTLIVIR